MKAIEGTVSAVEIVAYVAQDRYLSVSEASRYLAMSRRSLTDHLSEIPHYRRNGRLVFKRSELDLWMMKFRELEPPAETLSGLLDQALEQAKNMTNNHEAKVDEH